MCVWGGRCPFPLGDTLHLHADRLEGIYVTQLVPCSCAALCTKLGLHVVAVLT